MSPLRCVKVAGALCVKRKVDLKCCGKFLKPSVLFRASSADLLGILFLGGFFGGIYLLIGWAVSAGLWASIESGEIGSRTYFDAREGTGLLVALILLVKGMPIFLKILSYFVNYQLRIHGTCRVCGDKRLLVDAPDKSDPF